MDILQNDQRRAKVQGGLYLSSISTVLLLLFIFTMPFVSGFAYSGTLPMPLFFAVFLFFIMVLDFIDKGKFPPGFIGYDLLIILSFVSLAVFSFLVNGLGNSKSLNHAIAYCSTFLLFYVAIKFAFFKISNKEKLVRQVLLMITVITILNALFVNAEFLLSNFGDFNLNLYIPRPADESKSYSPLVLGVFIRARGFAAESGHFSFMMELFAPLTIYYLYFSGFCKWNFLLKIASVILIFFSLIFATSSASFVIIPIAILLASVVHIKRISAYVKRHTKKFIISSIIISVLILAFDYALSLFTLISLSLTNKVDSNSFDDRQERIDFFYRKFSELDIIGKIGGAGPAGFDVLGYDDSKGILSLYYSVTFELGFMGLFIMAILFLWFIFNAINIKTKIGFFFLISIISGVMHYYFISNFWYPWFWFVAAFAVFYNKAFKKA